MAPADGYDGGGDVVVVAALLRRLAGEGGVLVSGGAPSRRAGVPRKGLSGAARAPAGGPSPPSGRRQVLDVVPGVGRVGLARHRGIVVLIVVVITTAAAGAWEIMESKKIASQLQIKV